jgi:hypothetical protein
MTLRFPWIVLVGVILSAAGASAHGTEREYGTPINGRGVRETGSTGSPAFTLMALESNSSAILRAFEAGHTSDAYERIQRFPKLIDELQRRCANLDTLQSGHAKEVASVISESAARIEAAAGTDEPAVRHELLELRRHVVSMQALLRQDSDL